MRIPKKLRAFTAIELLIVLVLMAMMLTLLAPAVQTAKEAALLNSSRNNMKQIALAMQNHSDTYKTFPPLYFASAKSEQLKNNLSPLDATGMYTWQVRLTPFMEEDTLYKSISVASQKFTLPSDKLKVKHNGKEIVPSEISIGEFQAPQLGKNLKAGTCNYMALSSTRQPLLLNVEKGADGTQSFKKPFPDGMIVPDKLGRGQSMARMADGTSKTAVACESRELERSNWFNPQQAFVCGFLPADTTAVTDPAGEFYPYYVDGKFVPNPTNNRTALNFGPTDKDAKRAYNADAKDPLARTWGPSGGHLKDVTVHGMGDGSVLEVASNTDPKLYFALITTRGFENVPVPDNDYTPATDRPAPLTRPIRPEDIPMKEGSRKQ